MSVHIVDPTHIDVILSVAINGPKDRWMGWIPPAIDEPLASADTVGPISPDSADRTGKELLKQCIDSVSIYHREERGQLPGPLPNPDPDQYRWYDFGRILTAIEACRAIAYYEEQSSHDPSWWITGAHRFCHRLRAALVGQLPGFAEAEPHWTVDLALSRASRDRGFGDPQ